MNKNGCGQAGKTIGGKTGAGGLTAAADANFMVGKVIIIISSRQPALAGQKPICQRIPLLLNIRR
jgi:hypothetical protein